MVRLALGDISAGEKGLHVPEDGTLGGAEEVGHFADPDIALLARKELKSVYRQVNGLQDDIFILGCQWCAPVLS